MIIISIVKAMGDEGDQLVGVKGPMPSWMMSILYVIDVKSGNIL